MKKVFFITYLSLFVVSAYSQFKCGDTLIDIRDGQKYATVQIGTQCWMAQNLNYGIMIVGIDQSNNAIAEKYCYHNDTNNCLLYGGLYQFNEVMDYNFTPGSKGLCPDGWHVPTDEEYTILSSNYPNSPGIELAPGGSSGFNLQYGGFSSNFTFASLNIYCNLRTSTESGSIPGNTAYVRYTYPSDTGFYRSNYPNKSAYSLRCIQDTINTAISEVSKISTIYISDAYPNPATNYFISNYYLHTNQSAEIIFFNILSKEYLRCKIDDASNTIKINTDAFSKGIYFYRIISRDECSITKKVIIYK